MMAPGGGPFIIAAVSAAAMVRQIEPRIVVPMNFGTPPLDRGLASVGSFLEEMGLKEVEPRPKLTVTRATLPQGTQVALLQY